MNLNFFFYVLVNVRPNPSVRDLYSVYKGSLCPSGPFLVLVWVSLAGWDRELRGPRSTRAARPGCGRASEHRRCPGPCRWQGWRKGRVFSSPCLSIILWKGGKGQISHCLPSGGNSPIAILLRPCLRFWAAELGQFVHMQVNIRGKK